MPLTYVVALNVPFLYYWSNMCVFSWFCIYSIKTYAKFEVYRYYSFHNDMLQFWFDIWTIIKWFVFILLVFTVLKTFLNMITLHVVQCWVQPIDRVPSVVCAPGFRTFQALRTGIHYPCYSKREYKHVLLLFNMIYVLTCCCYLVDY